MKTTFSYFPGMVENPAPVKYYSKKKRNKKYYKILTLYEYVKLFGIKLFYLRSELMLHVSKFVWTLYVLR